MNDANIVSCKLSQSSAGASKNHLRFCIQYCKNSWNRSLGSMSDYNECIEHIINDAINNSPTWLLGSRTVANGVSLTSTSLNGCYVLPLRDGPFPCLRSQERHCISSNHIKPGSPLEAQMTGTQALSFGQSVSQDVCMEHSLHWYVLVLQAIAICWIPSATKWVITIS